MKSYSGMDFHNGYQWGGALLKTASRSLFGFTAILVVALAYVQPARADSVAQVQTTKYFAPETVALIKQRVTDVANGVPGATLGFKMGDTVNYIIQFTPISNSCFAGSMGTVASLVGAGGYITDYIPNGTQVVDAAFVQPDGFGGFYEVAPPMPAQMADGWGNAGQNTFTNWTPTASTLATCIAAGKTAANCTGRLADLYADTGIFYSTDPRTTLFAEPTTDGRAQQWTNGYNVIPTRGGQVKYVMGAPGAASCAAAGNATTHNLWDAAMTNAFGTTTLPATVPNAGNSIISTAGAPPYNAGSPVAGPDVGVQLDYTGGIGPWQRISYAGSTTGSNASGPALALGAAAVKANPTMAGASFPLPSNTNAVRWAAGRLTVGTQNYVKISLLLTATPPGNGLVNNSEVFGGDTSPEGGTGNRDNAWIYHVPSVASNISTLYILKEVLCVYDATGVCVPNSGANLPITVTPATVGPKVRYRISYINTNNGTQHNVVICDQLPVAPVTPIANVTQVSANPSVGAPASPAAAACGFAAGGTTFSYPVIPVISGGGAGIIEYDVQYPLLTAGTIIVNAAKAVSTEVPGGVVSNVPSNVVTSSSANLMIAKSVTSSTPAKGNTVSYSVTVTNIGSTAASLSTLVDTLPGAATATVANQVPSRLNYVATSSITVNGAPLSGVTTAVSVLTPATINNEVVTWTFPTGTTVPAGGQLVVTFTATVGGAGATNVMAYGTAYNNTATINCSSACVVAPVAPDTTTSNTTGATAPITLTLPALQLTKSIDCVFVGGVCTAGSYVAGSNLPVNPMVRYKLVYTNPTGAAQTITLTDTLPAQTTAAGNLYVASGPDIRPSTPVLSVNSAAAGAPRGADVALTATGAGAKTFTPAVLAAGTSGTLYMDVQFTAAATVVVTNNSSIQSSERAAAGGATVTAPAVSATVATLNITKTAGVYTGNAAGWGTVTYTITVTNPSAAGVVLTSVVDTLPKPLPSVAGRTILCGNAAGGTTAANCLAATAVTINGVAAAVAPTLSPAQVIPTATVGQITTWLLGGTALQRTLNAGQSMTLTFTAVYSATVLKGQTYSNTVTLNYTGGTTTTGLTAPVTVPYNTLSVTKSVVTPVSASTAPNSPVTYAITVTNTGSTLVPVTSVVDSLPSATAGLISYTSTSSVVVASGAAGTNVVTTTAAAVGVQQQITWTFTGASINPGSTMVITFVVQYGAIPTGMSYPNDVRVNFTGGLSSNVIGSNLAPVSVPVITKITKTIDCIYQPTCTPGSYVDGTPIPVNGLLGYKIVYENLSSVPATGISITDTLPTQVGVNAISSLVVNGTPTAAPPNALGGGTVTLLTGGTLPAAPSTGTITFALQTTAAAGAGVTNLAKIVSTQDPVGVTSSSTAQAAGGNLAISKAVTTATSSTVAQGGTASYTITVTNTGTAAATLTSIADTLPGVTPVAIANRFSYAATSSLLLNGSPLTAPVPGVVNNGATNRDTVTWTFAPSIVIPAGQNVKLTFTATVGTNIPKGAAAPGVTYYNDVNASYTGGAFTTTSASSQAPVLVPFNTLTMSKSIDCVYDVALTTCQAYVAGSPVPPSARIRYRLDYGNISPVAQIVTVKDTLPASTTAAGNLYVGSGPEIRPSVPAMTQNPALAAAARGVDAALTAIAGNTVVAMTAASLPGNSSGSLFMDVQTNAVAGGSVANCAIVTTDPANTCAVPGVGVSSTVTTPVQNVAVLSLSKTTSTPNVAPGGTATYIISITNTGTAATQTLKIYDFLPYSGTSLVADKRFAYVTTTGYTGGLPVPTITTSVAPTVSPYSSNLNQQQVLWDFGNYALAVGATVTITFNATVGSGMPNVSYYNSARHEFTSASISFNGNANNQALVSVTNPTPSLMFLKTVQVYSDPVNGVNNPAALPTPIYAKFIPGALAGYTLIATNSGTGPVDNNSLVITDPLQSDVALFVNDIGGIGSGPFSFTQGATASGLTYTFTSLSSATDDLDFYGGTPTPAWGYVPVPGADGCDPLVSNIRINPKGAFTGSPVAPSPSFNLNFRVCVK